VLSYRLDPVAEMLGSELWHSSSIAPTTAWVRATDDWDARERMSLATAQARRAKLGDDSPLPPWKDARLVLCVLDGAIDVPEGVVLTIEGQTLEIP
jgi:hypothetical protein